MAVTGLSPGHQYEFRVYAENVYGRSDASDTTGLVTTKSSGKKVIKKKQYEGNFNFPLSQISGFLPQSEFFLSLIVIWSLLIQLV